MRNKNDTYAKAASGLEHTARNAFAIVPSDTASLKKVTRSIYVGGVGDISVILADESAAVTFVAVPVGTLLPIRAKLVRASGTTATSLVGLW